VQSQYRNLANGLRVHFLYQQGVGPSIVMIHGLASNAKMYRGVGQRLSAHGYSLCSVDQRGHGETDKPDGTYDYDTFVQDLKEFLVLAVNEGLLTVPAVFVGQSFGCSVVENYALRYPSDVRGLVLIDGGFRALKKDYPTWQECEAKLSPPRFDNYTISSLRQRLQENLSDFPDSAFEGILANFKESPEGNVSARLERSNHIKILRELWEQNPVEIFEKISTPFIFITALNDEIVDSATKREEIRRLREISDAASSAYWIAGHHDLHAQHPDYVAQIIHREIEEGVFSTP